MDKNFIHEFNKAEVRNAKKECICKVCDRKLINETIVYLKSFRLNAQPFHICIPCWMKLNKLVEEELSKGLNN